jgi:hypothetical protein
MRERRVQMHNRTYVAALERFFVVCVAKERERYAVGAERRFYAERDIFGVGERVHIFKVFTRVDCVLLEVEIGSVGNTPKLAPADGKRIRYRSYL